MHFSIIYMVSIFSVETALLTVSFNVRNKMTIFNSNF